MTDRERWSLRGPVHQSQLRRTWYIRQCGAGACEPVAQNDESVVEFDRRGTWIRKSHRNPDGSESTWTPSDYAERATHRYGPGDRREKIVAVTERSGTMTLHGVEGTDSCYSAPGTASVTTIYQAERPVEVVFRNQAEAVISRVVLVYDSLFNLVEEIQTREGATLPEGLGDGLGEAQLATVRALFGAGGEGQRFRHRYDGLGRRIESHSTFAGLEISRKFLEYNEQSDVSRGVHEEASGEFGFDDNGQLTRREERQRGESRFQYQYDEHGNWVEKIVESRYGDADFSVSTVEHRTIDYFTVT